MRMMFDHLSDAVHGLFFFRIGGIEYLIFFEKLLSSTTTTFYG